jgi:FAD/FMN-containing dehydrogenase
VTRARDSFQSWGGLQAGDGPVLQPDTRSELVLPTGPWLAFGNGRSYGDSCLPAEGTLIDMRGLNGLLGFDPHSGVLHAEAGLLLADLMPHVILYGWFPAVVPGTRFITLGGAIANDIHGKNHHRQGTFGEHVLSLELLRSDGGKLKCSPTENADLFRATIGGMGLTGLILSVELQLMRTPSPNVMQEVTRLESLADFFRLAPSSDTSHAYSVAWIDSLATGSRLGRGVLLCANHLESAQLPAHRGKPLISVPFTPPVSLINRMSLAAFNRAYRHRALSRAAPTPVDFTSFFFPLDAVGHWNRLYGPGGLRQHQSIIPLDAAQSTFAAMLEETHRARHGSFLTVLKLFADRPAAGIMSFARGGATLTLDFPYRGPRTDALLDRLDSLTIAAGGRVNPYKDAHMSAATFAASFPQMRAFQPYMDPMARSRLASRVGLAAPLASACVSRAKAAAA